ncbi:MAG TPA: divergent PAP2 family protein [Patescibacteria group bacterium]|nr:divergent PAP2 family protein [Patescibacteria group bacterium]
MFDVSKYYVFLIPLFIGSLIHAIKFVLFYFRHNRDLKYTLEHGMTYGHMPSSHTGFAISLITSVGYYEGIDTGSFAVALALAIIIIDEAFRLRMQMGDQAKRMNIIAAKLNLDPAEFPRLKERVGHKKIEVIIGGILGFFFTIWLIKILEIYPIVF